MELSVERRIVACIQNIRNIDWKKTTECNTEETGKNSHPKSIHFHAKQNAIWNNGIQFIKHLKYVQSLLSKDVDGSYE
jgi:hypothetical protein